MPCSMRVGMCGVVCWWDPGRRRKQFCHSCLRRAFGVENERVYLTHEEGAWQVACPCAAEADSS